MADTEPPSLSTAKQDSTAGTSVPMLLRLRRRFGTWRAPAIALGVFTVMFALTAFVIGPAISGTSASDNTGTPTNAPSPTVDHDSHH